MVSRTIIGPLKITGEAPPRRNSIKRAGKITENLHTASSSGTCSSLTEPQGRTVTTGSTLVFSDDYRSQLLELQQKIVTLQDNQVLRRVAQVIAETGQYEETSTTFDFDLCGLDRPTVQRLQQCVSAL